MRTAGPWSGVQEVLLALALALTSRGAEHTIWNGDKRSVEFLYEDHFHRNIPLVGKREYGIRAGLPRILKLFKKYDYKFTGWFCARALEVHGDYGKLIVEHGHEASRLQRRIQHLYAGTDAPADRMPRQQVERDHGPRRS
jgi:hypothetical protein